MANDGQAEEGSVSGGGRQPAAGGGCPTALPASDPPLSRRSVAAVFAGLLVAMTVGTLNQTIVATVLPTIVGELGGVNRMLWVTTSYVLAATVTMPLYGKMGDLIGRKGLFIGALALLDVYKRQAVRILADHGQLADRRDAGEVGKQEHVA